MFPRISTSIKNGRRYDYLVISESIHVTGKGSTTRNIATLGNIKRFSAQDVANLIDGFIRIFKLEKYCLSEDVQLLESLEHGSIIFWQKLWDELGLSKIIKNQVKLKDKRIKLEVDKYVQMMVINRCVEPLSKLGVTRWIERTCYKEMAGYKDLDFDVTYFYRSMDHLLKVKEFLIWKSKKIIREQRADVADKQFALLEKEILGLSNKSEPKSGTYKSMAESIIKGIDSKVCAKVFRGIKKYQGRYEDELRYIICLNEQRKAGSEKKRQLSILKLSKELNKVFSANARYKEDRDIDKALHKIFEGYKVKFKKFFTIARDAESKKATGYSLNQEKIEQEKKFDGIFVLLSSRYDLKPSEVVDSYKNLKEVEMLFDDLKNFVDIRPIRHWLPVRVRAHVFICVLALLLKRIFEIHYMKSKCTMEPLEEISKSKLIKYQVKFSKREDRSQTFPKVTNTTPMQKKYFNMIGIRNPMSLEKFIW